MTPLSNSIAKARQAFQAYDSGTLDHIWAHLFIVMEEWIIAPINAPIAPKWSNHIPDKYPPEIRKRMGDRKPPAARNKQLRKCGTLLSEPRLDDSWCCSFPTNPANLFYSFWLCCLLYQRLFGKLFIFSNSGSSNEHNSAKAVDVHSTGDHALRATRSKWEEHCWWSKFSARSYVLANHKEILKFESIGEQVFIFNDANNEGTLFVLPNKMRTVTYSLLKQDFSWILGCMCISIESGDNAQFKRGRVISSWFVCLLCDLRNWMLVCWSLQPIVSSRTKFSRVKIISMFLSELSYIWGKRSSKCFKTINTSQSNNLL